MLVGYTGTASLEETVKRVLSIGLASMLALAFLTACSEEEQVIPTPTRGIEFGQYTGEKNAAGEPHGQGVWIFDNYRYEGSFVNGVPEGEGTMVEANEPPTEQQPSQIYVDIVMVKGQWSKGFGTGKIELTWKLLSGQEETWKIDVVDGCVSEGGQFESEQDSTPMQFDAGTCIAGIPPWAPIITNPDLPAPTPN